MSIFKRSGLGVIVLSAVAILVTVNLYRDDPEVGEEFWPEREEVVSSETAPRKTTRTPDNPAPMEPKRAAGETTPMESMNAVGETAPMEARLAAGEATPMESMNAAGEMAPMEAQLAAGEMAPMESMNAAGESAAPVEAMLAAGAQVPAECQLASGACVMEGIAEAMCQEEGSMPGAGINLMEEEREDFMREKMTEQNDGANLGRAPKGGS